MLTPAPGKPSPLYQVMIDDILTQIDEGEFSFNQPICTENKLMEKHGVSRITARRAMTELENRGILYRKRGVGSFVSRDVYQRKQPPIHTVNSASSSTSKLFAFIFPFSLHHSGLKAAFQAANTALLRAGYAASIYITEDEANTRGRTFLNQLIRSDIAGVAYYPKTADIHLNLLNHLIFQGKSVVLIDLPSPSRYISSVSSDNYGGSVQLMEYLLALGHRRIAYVAGLSPDARRTLGDRLDGYVLSLHRAGLTVDADLIVTALTEDFRRAPGADGSPTQVHATARALLAQGVTAILCEHDQLAYELTVACREMRVRVPEQLSICGFDNSEWAGMLPGGITTVQQNMEQVGQHTASLLLEGLHAPLSQARQIVVPTHLVTGATTCAIPGANTEQTEEISL
ncbi:MAG: GntR family transcriptional regulator [Clostridia bacterium]|nr:GntR family transcriptional regulator [Clostridia bacterium]